MNYLRKLVSALLVLTMVLSMFRLGTVEANASGHSAHAVCSDHCTHEESHETVSFRKWTGSNFASGNYYMDEDITLSSDLIITGDAHLCLNGHTLTIEQAFMLRIETAASLTICDCVGTGQLVRGTGEGYSTGDIISNYGNFTIFGGTYCIDGGFYGLQNAGNLTIFDGTFGIPILNIRDDWSFSTVRCGNAVIYNASVVRSASSSQELLYNAEGCSMVIHGGNYSSDGRLLYNLGTADIQGGNFQCTSNYWNIAIETRGDLVVRNAEISITSGEAIRNDARWDSSYNRYTYRGDLSIYEGSVITSGNSIAVSNFGDFYLYGGNISGLIGIQNSAANNNPDYDGGCCYVSGGTVTGTMCAIRNGGTTEIRYSNGVPTWTIFYKGKLEIGSSPSLGKVILSYPDAFRSRITAKSLLTLNWTWKTLKLMIQSAKMTVRVCPI